MVRVLLLAFGLAAPSWTAAQQRTEIPLDRPVKAAKEDKSKDDKTAKDDKVVEKSDKQPAEKPARPLAAEDRPRPGIDIPAPPPRDGALYAPAIDRESLKYLRQKTVREKEEQLEKAKRELDAIMESELPQSPEEIRVLRERQEVDQQARNYRGVPKSAGLTDPVWATGDPPLTLNLSHGYTSTVLFYDQNGKPLSVQAAPAGAHVGDKSAYKATAIGHAVSLDVLKPFVSTNMNVWLDGVHLPVPFTLRSHVNPEKVTVDYQVRVRIITSTAKSVPEANDKHQMSALLKMVSGLGGTANHVALPVERVEKSPTGASGLDWVAVSRSLGQFFAGTDGRTYVILPAGYELRTPTSVLARQAGGDGTLGYILAGHMPRVFTVTDSIGNYYRIIVRR